jgi:hypothetical protein
VKCANAVVVPLISKQDMFESLPHLIAATFAPDRNVHVLDLIDTDKLGVQIVEAEASLEEICTLIHIFNPQWYPQPSKIPLQLSHPPFSSLTIGED